MSIDDDTCNFCNGYDTKYLASQVYLIQSLAFDNAREVAYPNTATCSCTYGNFAIIFQRFNNTST